MAEIQGLFSTGDLLSAARSFSPSDKLWLAYSDVSKLAFFARKLDRRPVTDPKFRWFEQSLPQDYVQINYAVGYSSSDINLVVDDSSPVRAGTVLKSLTSGEQMRVTANNLGTNTITVQRGWGTTAAAAIADNEVLVVVGDASMDGSSKPEAIRRSPVEKYNYTQIFREPTRISGTALATFVYYATNDEKAALENALQVHKRKIEKSFLFGEPKEDLTGAEPVRATGGITSYVTTNVVDAGGTLTETEWEDFVRTAFTVGENKMALVSPLIATALSFWAKNKLVMYPKDKTYGIDIVELTSPHGSFKVTTERLLAEKQVWNGYAFIIDMDRVGYRYLSLGGENRDTQLIKDTQNPGDDAKEKEYRTECGLFIANENAHAILKGVTSYS